MNPAASLLSYSPQQVISQAFNFDAAALFAEDDQGQVQLNGALLYIKIYHQETSNVLLLMAHLGLLPTQHRSAYYQMMLVGNSSGHDLAGGALCTDESGDQAILRRRLDLNTLSAEKLVQWLSAFVTAAETWAERVAPLPSQTNTPDIDVGFVRPQELLGLFPFNRA